jgi:hypothetical protein
MTESENFIARWARRKLEAAEEAEQAKPADVALPTPAGAEAPPPESLHSATGQKAEPVFDLAQLPSIESITAQTDIRAFLAPGVPADFARAALRRVWAADPAIRDFKGLADYDWDFTTPGAMPGFGPLEMTDELRQWVSDMVGRSITPAPPEPSVAGAEADRAPAAADSATELAGREAKQPQQNQPLPQVTQEVAVNISDETQRSIEAAKPATKYIAVQYSPESNEAPESIARRPHGRALPK